MRVCGLMSDFAGFRGLEDGCIVDFANDRARECFRLGFAARYGRDPSFPESFARSSGYVWHEYGSDVVEVFLPVCDEDVDSAVRALRDLSCSVDVGSGSDSGVFGISAVRAVCPARYVRSVLDAVRRF